MAKLTKPQAAALRKLAATERSWLPWYDWLLVRRQTIEILLERSFVEVRGGVIKAYRITSAGRAALTPAGPTS